MPEITLSISEEVHKKMKEHEGVGWSEVVRDAILDYIYSLEGRKMEVTTEELQVGRVAYSIGASAKISMEKAVKNV